MKKYYLEVSFNEKDNAKKFGARWDGQHRKWYWAGETELPDGLKLYNPKEVVYKAANKESVVIRVSFNNNEAVIKASWREAYEFMSAKIEELCEESDDQGADLDQVGFDWRIEFNGRYTQENTGPIMFDALCEGPYAMELYFKAYSSVLPEANIRPPFS